MKDSELIVTAMLMRSGTFKVKIKIKIEIRMYIVMGAPVVVMRLKPSSCIDTL